MYINRVLHWKHHILSILMMLLCLEMFLESCSNENTLHGSPTSPQINPKTPHQLCDNGDGTVTDLGTGLIWLKEAACFGAKNRTQSMDAANALKSGNCGLTDDSRAGEWRVPQIKELLSLLDYTQNDPALPASSPFQHLQGWYWSSSIFTEQTGQGWGLNVQDGDIAAPPVSIARYVLPVRGNSLSQPSLSDKGNGTIFDAKTGLFWLKEANCFNTKIQPDAVGLVTTLADGACGLSDGSTAGDWHLPSVDELLTLLDYSRQGTVLPAGHPFEHVKTYYWTSTSFAHHSGYAWNIYLRDSEIGSAGDFGADPVMIPGFVLPVRNGM